MEVINARGLSCPIPVLETKKAIEENDLKAVKIIIDNEAAQQNVTRFLESQGFETSTQKTSGDYQVIGKSGVRCRIKNVPAAVAEPVREKILIMITTDKIGVDNVELGSKLMNNFIKTLNEMGTDLWQLVFLNNGVKFTTKDSDVLSTLKNLEKQGCKILVCGTCLDHFNLLDQKQVGETTNMLDIVTAMQLADKVINI